MEQLADSLNFQYDILNKVSRSFALTIPLLPEQLKISVANGYLLCRITDTIEDDSNLSLEQKAYFHKQFIRILNDPLYDQIQNFVQELHPLLSEQTSIHEKLLILNLHKILTITESLNPDTKYYLKTCVIIMNNGMLEFEKIININGFNTVLELEKYCYIVAGVVGEMLTELFCKYLNLSIEYKNQLMPLARSFGQALQITNILKDRWSDYSKKICYLPKEFFGETLEPLTINNLFNHNIKKIININLTHLNNALNYILLIPKQETGIRKFCLWAIGMSIKILQNIKNNPGFTNVNQIKISKFKLKQIIMVTNFVNKSNYLLKFWFKIVTAGL